MCRITVSAVTGNRISNSNQVDSFSLAAHVGRDCQSFRVEIFEASGFLPLFLAVIVQANGNPIDPNYASNDPVNDDTIVASFNLGQSSIAGVGISCGASIRIRITSTTPGCNCSVDDIFTISCKTLDPDSNNPGNGGNPGGNNGNPGGNNGNNNGGITWPSWFCPFTARAFAFILWLTLIGVALVVAGTGWIPQPVIVGGITAASIFLAAWLFVCRPSMCAVLRLITLVFMMATLATFLLAIGFRDFTLAALGASYGGLTAFWITIMRARGCSIPRFP